MSGENFTRRLVTHIQGNYNLATQELTVVFPNKRAAFYLRNEFQNLYTQNIWLPQMLSIQEAVTQWSGITLVDTIDMLFELIDIDAQLQKKQTSELSVFGSQATQMAKDFDEIDQYDIDAQLLFRYVVDNKKTEIWNFDEAKSESKEQKYLRFFTSLYDYYLRLRDRLMACNQGYYGMITRYLTHLSDEELMERIGDRKVLFAGFNALTTTEEHIIDKLVKNGKAEILFDYDKYYIDDEQNEAGLFARRYLIRHPEWMKNGITDKLNSEEKHIHIVSAGGNTLQTKALQEHLQDGKTADQAVILADESLLIPVLNAIPETETIKNFHVSMGYPISKTPVNQFIKATFRLQRKSRIIRKTRKNGAVREVRGWYIWPFLQTMDLELVKTIFTAKETAIFDHWKTEQLGKGKFILEKSDIDSLKQIPDFQSFIKLLLNSEIDEEKQTPEILIQSIIQLLSFISNKIQKRKDEKGILFLLNQVSEVGKIMNRISQVHACHSDYLNDLGDIEILYRLLASNTSIKLNSSNTKGLQIMGLLETRNIDFKHLHVLSVNEGILPTDKSLGSFIPPFIKREYNLPGYTEKQAVFAYHFYRLLQNGEHIYLYYNNLGDSSGGEESRYILQIRHELKHNPNIYVHEDSFSCTTETDAETKIEVPKTTTIEQLKLMLQQKGLSPTSLSTYLACPLKFFLKYIAQIKDDSVEEEIGANITGTIVHDTLEFLFADYLPKEKKLQIIDKDLFDKKIMPLWETKLEQSISKNMPYGFSDVGFNYMKQVSIRQQLKNYLQYTSKQLKNNELVILKTEGELRAKLPAPFENYFVVGRTDRIDRWNGIVRVIDYKTGKVETKDLTIPLRKPDDNDLSFLRSIPEKALQLLLYKYMYLKENQQINQTQIEATIHALKYANTIEFGLTHSKKDGVIPFLEGDTFLNDMEALLKAVVSEMLDTGTPFCQTDDEKKCRNCDFKVMCKRS